MEIGQITIVGTGLIGGSLGLALKKHGFARRVVGCDREPVLEQARRRGAIDLGIMDLKQAVHGADVVVLATPVGAVLDLIEKIGPIVPAKVLLTDVGSTKAEVVERARAVFGAEAGTRFLAGHPMAGKENSGIEEADADLFEGAVWLITPGDGIGPSGDRGSGKPTSAKTGQMWGTKALGTGALENPYMPETGKCGAPTSMDGESIADAWIGWIERIGARVVVMDAERHDRLCAWVSHLPQMVATAMAACIEDEFGDDEELKAIGGRALREMTRIAASPYSMWRDIALTNTGNIEDALMQMEQRLAHMRENLKTRGLQEEFEKGNRFRNT